MSSVSNVPLKDFLKFLENKGLNHNRTKGGHYHYYRKDLKRPVTVQSHKDPVPRFIVQNILNQIGSSKKELDNFLNPPKGTAERETKTAKKGKRSNKSSGSK